MVFYSTVLSQAIICNVSGTVDSVAQACFSLIHVITLTDLQEAEGVLFSFSSEFLV